MGGFVMFGNVLSAVSLWIVGRRVQEVTGRASGILVGDMTAVILRKI